MSRPIRVLQLAKHFSPDRGGIETVTKNISDMLIDKGVQADVLCMEMAGPYEPTAYGYQVMRCKADLSVGNKRLSWRYVREGIRLQSAYDCALVHIPNPLAVMAALAWRKPVIPLWHADIPQPLIRRATALLDRRLLHKTAAVVGSTPVHLATSSLADAIGDRGVVIPYPFDPSSVPSPGGDPGYAGRLETFRRGRAMAIAIGRLVPYKGFDILIEAAKSFGDQLCVLIVGTGPLAEDLQEQIRAAGLEDRVCLAGELSPDALGEALGQARIGCMPSVTAAEMYGMAQLECMAAGLPVVSTDIERSGVPFVNKHDVTGLIVAPGDPGALARALRNLVEDPLLWDRLSQGALRSIREDHDVDVVAGRYVELLHRLVAKD